MAAVIDVDSHVHEPAAVWDEYVPPGDRERVRRAFCAVTAPDGTVTTTLNGRPAKGLNRSKVNRQAIWRPGMTIEQIGDLDPDTGHELNPGAWDAAARLADMDAMGIDRAVVYPTLLNEYLAQVEDKDAATILCRAYNDWVWDLAEGGGGRLHPVAMLALQDPAAALDELERAHAKGFRAALLRPAFYKVADAGDSIGAQMLRMQAELIAGTEVPDTIPLFVEDRPFRPLFARCAELGVVACVHPAANVTGPDAVSSGGFAERVSERVGVRHSVAEPIAYMQDADLFMTASFFHGLFEDLPSLHVAIVHAGTTWVPLALEKCETYLWLGAGGGVPVCLEPEEVWDRHPVLTSFDSWERPVARMVERIGQKAAWGSRYPHHDTGTPAQARAMLESSGVEEGTIDRLLGGYAAEIFGLAVPAGR
ncbi:MAG TPA: amidohydrolase family protein [Acidimicrobiales bacterium]|nr:amidohydrolase family protein [Acidimicrobiales bacterium]